VINAAKIALTGNKLQKKIYYHHTEYIGNLKAIPAGELLAKSPDKVIRRAVKGMLPSGPLGFSLITKLKVFDGPQHTHSAQQPQPFELHN
jgi:large subunit ribosomal protein L13